MDILYLHRTQGTGVEGVHIWGIANGFKSLGHSVKVVSPAGVHEDQQSLLSQSTKPNTSSKDTTSRKNDDDKQQRAPKKTILSALSQYMPELLFEFAEIAYNLIAFRKLNRLSKKSDYRFIYERYAIFAIAGAVFAKRNNIPIMLEVNYTSCSPLVRKRSALLKPLARYVDRKLYNAVDYIVVVSTFLKEHLIRDYSISEHKILICPNAADPDKFSDRVEAVKDVSNISLLNKKVIGFVGTFAPWHGVTLLLDAFIKISDEFEDLILLLVGDGPELPLIQQKVLENGLKGRVCFAGKVNHQDLPSYVATFSVGVMPDSNEYGSPMKIFEYMAMGKPVVVPDYGPLIDVVENNKQGKVFSRKDVNSLAESLGELFSDDKKLAKFGVLAREHIVKKHNWLSNAERSLDFAVSGR